VPVIYNNIKLETDLRCDFLVGTSLVVELKSVDMMAPVFDAQILTYMKLLNVPKGILINFNSVNVFKEGQKTFVNELFGSLPDE
jgi:GxxExxY protein